MCVWVFLTYVTFWYDTYYLLITHNEGFFLAFMESHSRVEKIQNTAFDKRATTIQVRASRGNKVKRKNLSGLYCKVKVIFLKVQAGTQAGELVCREHSAEAYICQ